jgi:phage terminase small subunit
MGELTPKQKIFVLEYMKDFNATRAAKAAGYSAKTARQIGQKNLTKLAVQEALLREKDGLSQRTERLRMEIDDIRNEYRNIALLDMADYIRVAEGGEIQVIPFDQLPEGAAKYIKKLKERRVIKESKDGETIMVYDNIEFELHDKMKALENLGRSEGMFKENVHHTHEISEIIRDIRKKIDGKTAGLPSEDEK